MTIKITEANRAISAALEKAAELKELISVTVCDSAGHLIAHERMDGVLAWATHFSIGKAIASAECGIPSGDPIPHLPHRPLTAVVTGTGAPDIHRRGGLPIFRRGKVVGGVGVSGATTNELDEVCAKAAVEALKR